MKKNTINDVFRKSILLILSSLVAVVFSFCSGIFSGEGSNSGGGRLVFHTQVNPSGIPLEVVFEKGKAFNHPLMAIWVEDLEGNYTNTLYVAESIAKGYFRHGDLATGRWMPGPLRRPAALPYWAHKRGVRAEDGLFIPSITKPVEDAFTGATPKTNFTLQTQTPCGKVRKFNVLFEINQSWDWNHYWHNNKFPNDAEYKTSAQPALVYIAKVDLDSGAKNFPMTVIGHSHWSGAAGTLFKDVGNITTAMNITKAISVNLP